MKEIVALMITVGSFALCTSCTYYIRSGPYSEVNDAKVVSLQWSTIQYSIARYFTSHRVLCFLPGVYNLDKNISVTDVVNFTITGNKKVTFQCTSNAAVFVNASINVSIKNMKFENCGVKIISTVGDTPYVLAATISLFNVQSVVLSNITFENSLGHGIVGINVLGSSTLVNITVYHNNNLSGNSLTSIGGIILVYVDTIDDVHHNQTQSQNHVLIKTLQYDA